MIVRFRNVRVLAGLMAGALALGGLAVAPGAFGADDPVEPEFFGALAVGVPQTYETGWDESCLDPNRAVPAVLMLRTYSLTLERPATVTLTLAYAPDTPVPGHFALRGYAVANRKSLKDATGGAFRAVLSGDHRDPKIASLELKAGTYGFVIETGPYCNGAATLTLDAVTPLEGPLKVTGPKSLKKGAKKQLAVKFKSAKGAGALKYKSSKPKVAKIDAKGKVKALRRGTTVLTVTTPGGQAVSHTLRVK